MPQPYPGQTTIVHYSGKQWEGIEAVKIFCRLAKGQQADRENGMMEAEERAG
jgi:hypothetical protein